MSPGRSSLREVFTPSRECLDEYKVSGKPVQLSQDALQTIFEAMLPPRLRDALAVSHVSRAWRSAALACAYIWSHIQLEDIHHYATLLPVVFERSRATPLNVQLDFSLLAVEWRCAPGNLELLSTGLRVLKHQIQRCDALEVRFVDFDYNIQALDFFPADLDLPITRRLKVVSFRAQTDKPMNIRTPVLQNIYLCDVLVHDWRAVVGQNTREITWINSVNVRPSLEPLPLIFKLCPHLERLHLAATFAPPIHPRSSQQLWPIALGANLFLKLGTVAATAAFLSHLDLTRVRDIMTDITTFGLRRTGHGIDDYLDTLRALLTGFGAVCEISLDNRDFVVMNDIGHTRGLRGSRTAPQTVVIAFVQALLGEYGAASTLRKVRLSARWLWTCFAKATLEYPITALELEIEVRITLLVASVPATERMKLCCPGLEQLTLVGRREDGAVAVIDRAHVDSYLPDMQLPAPHLSTVLRFDGVSILDGDAPADPASLRSYFAATGWSVAE